MSAWDDPITHIRELEAEVSRLRKVVARVEALRDAYYAWDGDPESEFSSSPRTRQQLDAALEGR